MLKLDEDYEFIIDYVNRNNSEPITEALIKEIHSRLTKNLPYQYNQPGEYRTVQITFGIPRIESILKTESEVKEAMSNFINWINDRKRGDFYNHTIVKANLAHFSSV